MNERHLLKLCLLTALVTVGANVRLDSASAAPASQANGQDGVQVLTRGPVHEAFAETVSFDPEPGIVVAKAPPAAIEELPPDQKPDGANVAWIPGYWAWDDERNDFLWVSGLWRDVPPNRQWVPGYWGKIAQGAQWTSGYWADAKLTEVEYLPEPPATAEAGPNIDAPSPDSSWIPGTWVWQQSRYSWRPGSWTIVQPNWVWVPAYYLWSPRGYVFNDGYWDYAVARRGLLFAPVYFSDGIYAQQGFSYSPSYVINPAVFASQLFLRPQFQHYYFGDYYATNYVNAGFYPWFAVNSGRSGYDPIFAQQRWEHRQDRAWEESIQTDFRNRRDHEEARPPRTLAAQQTLLGGSGTPREKGIVMAASLDDLAKSKDSPIKLQSLDKAERQKLSEHGKNVQKFRDERQQLESKQADTSAGTSGQKSQSAKMKLPQSPIVAKASDQLGKDYVPPKSYETPKPDLKVEPKQKVARSGDERPYTVNRQPLEIQQQQHLQPPQVSPGVEQPTLPPQSQLKVESKDIPKGASNTLPKAAVNEPAKGGSNAARAGGNEPPQAGSQGQPRGPSNEKPKVEMKAIPPSEPKDLPKAGSNGPPKAAVNQPPSGGSNPPQQGGGNGPPPGGSQAPPKGQSNEKPKGDSKAAPPGDPKDAPKK